jgi:hypothetical protein
LAGRHRPHLVVANMFINNNYNNTIRYHSSDTNSNINSSNKTGTGTVRNVSTSTQRQEQGEQEQNFHPIYVHHVSRIVLEHLQNNQHDWLMKYGLDRNLSLRANGTFLLKFRDNGGRVWTSYDSHKKQHWLSIYRNKLAVRFLLKDHELAAVALQQRQQFLIGEMNVEDYHKMSVQKIQLAVNEMINAVEQMEYKDKQLHQKRNQQ